MILIINLCREPLHSYEFVVPIQNIAKEHAKVNMKHIFELTNEDKNAATKIIICGTSLMDVSYLENLEKFEWLLQKDIPILGICAGAQIIGLLYKGELKKDLEIGLTKISFKEEFLGTKGDKEFYALHQNYSEFPKEFETYTDGSIPHAVKHKQKEIYAILEHPEVRNKEMIANFCSKN